MSRRFGRNQRRKLQAEIAARDGEIKRLGAVTSEHYRQMIRERTRRVKVEADLIEWAARILAHVPPESVFARELHRHDIDAGLFEAVTVGGAPYRLSPPSGRYDSLGPSREGAMNLTAARIVEAFAIWAHAEPEIARQAMRFQINGPNGAWALALDERTMQIEMRRGSPELARHLLTQLVEPFMERTSR